MRRRAEGTATPTAGTGPDLGGAILGALEGGVDERAEALRSAAASCAPGEVRDRLVTAADGEARLALELWRGHAAEAAQAVASDMASQTSLAEAIAAVEAGLRVASGMDEAAIWLTVDGRKALAGRAGIGGRPLGLRQPRLVERVARVGRSLVLPAADAVPVPAESAGTGVALAVPFRAVGHLVGIAEVSAAAPVELGQGRVVEMVSDLLAGVALGLHAWVLVAREDLVWRDPLTHLLNKRRFAGDLEALCLEAWGAGSGLGLLFIDLDHFKRVNDEFGHQVGDEVLVKVATVVQGAVRAGDSAYRFGGEEMCVIAPGVDGQGAHELGERVRSQVAAAFSDDERGLRVTASIGVATLAPPMKASDDLVRAADAAVYAAKAAGRDRVYDAPA